MPNSNLFYCLLMFILISCNSNNSTAQYIITTKVPIKEGKITDVLNLFKQTNPSLVKNQSDWISATFSQNPETSTVIVQAYWKNKTSYQEFSKSKKFQETMKQFGVYFNGKPEIEISEILFQM